MLDLSNGHLTPASQAERWIIFFKFHNFFMFLLCLLSPNLARTLKKKLISASIKMFRTKKLKSKSPTDSRDSNEKLKSSLFWMNYTIPIILVFLFENYFFWVGFWAPAEPSQPAWMDKSNHLFFYFFKPSLRSSL